MAIKGKNGDKKAVGRRIREARKALKLSADEFGRRVRLSANHVFVLERGEVSPSKRTLGAISKVTKRSVEWFKTGVEAEADGEP